MNLTVMKEFHATVMRDAASAAPSSSGACLLPEGVTEMALPGGGWCIVAHDVLSRGSLALLTVHTSLRGWDGWE